MKKILILFIILPTFCIAQNKGGYAQLAGDLSISKPLGTGAGGTFIIGHNVGNGSLGAGFDFIKYRGLDKITPSLYADFRYYLGKGIDKPLPYFTLTPGYFFYSSSSQVSTITAISKGGFLIGAGFGCILYSGHKTAPYLSVLYNKFPIKTTINNGKAATINYDVAKISVGVNF